MSNSKRSDNKLYIVIAFLIGIIFTQYIFTPSKEKASVQSDKESKDEEALQTITKMARQKLTTITPEIKSPTI